MIRYPGNGVVRAVINDPQWDDDKLFGIWIKQMLDAEIQLYEENEMVPDLIMLRDGPGVCRRESCDVRCRKPRL